MSHRTVDDSFIEFVLKNVFFDRQSLLEVFNGEFAHVHNSANIELVDPMGHFVYPQNRAFTIIAGLAGDEFFFHLLFVILGILLPVIKRRFVDTEREGLRKTFEQIIQDLLSERTNMLTEMDSLGGLLVMLVGS